MLSGSYTVNLKSYRGMKNVFYVITIIMSTLDTSHGISRISVHVNVIVGYISTQFKNL